jgi:polysaccharide export outer membrane protein
VKFIAACRALALCLPMLVLSGVSGQAQSIDPDVIRRAQEQLGATNLGPSPSMQLDQSRSSGEARDAAAGALPRMTAEERAFRREQSRLALEELYTPSPIEREYQQRLNEPQLRQFGYDLFQSSEAGSGPLTGQVSDDYVLGVGDELVVSFQGATNDSRTVRVDREGRVIVGQLSPIRAAGRTLGAVRRDLQAATRQSMLGTEVYASLGSVRAITVFVGGEVASPGQYQLTSLADLANAVARAGGIRKSGSLRRVRVVRGGSTLTVDLYGLIGIGSPPSVRLRDGDRVIVPVIGDTVAVVGNVARPAIYEIAGRVTVDSLLSYAGGTLRPRGNTLSISRIRADGSEDFIPVVEPDDLVMPGDVLQAIGGSPGGAVGRVSLRGFALNRGARSLTAAPTVRDLVGSPTDLRLGTYTPMAVLVRRDPVTAAREFEPVNLIEALGPGPSVPLRSNDRLYLFSRADIEFINRAEVRRIVLGQPNERPSCEPLEQFAALVRDTQSARFNTVIRGSYIVNRNGQEDIAGGAALSRGSVRDTRSALERAPVAPLDERMADERALDPRYEREVAGGAAYGADRYRDEDERGDGADSLRRRVEQARERDEEDPDCPSVFKEEPDLLPVLIENAIGVGGAVRRPAAYPVAGTVTPQVLASTAEGLITRAEDVIVDIIRSSGTESQIERLGVQTLASLGGVTLRAGDDIRFNAAQPQYEPGAVLLTGEFGRPGLYSIRKGETLSQLIARAGGLSAHAYPYGAVFTRRVVKELQEEGFRRTARELNTGLLAVAARRETSGDSLVAAARLVESLGTVEAPGRVVVEADPRVLALRPDLDTVLEPGDAIYMPKVPSFVLALGDVSNPSALQFVAGKGVFDYLRESGGTQRTADEGQVFIVFPNGAAQPVRNSLWRRRNIEVPPGSTIVVPKNVDPLRTLDLVRDVTTILAQLATSVATVAILSDNN